MIAGCLQQYLHAKLAGWGAGGLGHTAAEDLAEYERCWMRQTPAPAAAAAAAAAAATPAAAAATAAGACAAPGSRPAGDGLQQQDVVRRFPSVHAACEDYRVSAWDGIDMQHDRQSCAAGQKLRCDVLAAWGQRGVVARLFDVEGLWLAACGGGVAFRGAVVPGVGHFIPEEAPEFTAELLRDFFR
jgi:haloacetate dehalogenase